MLPFHLLPAQNNEGNTFRVLPYLLSPHQNSIVINWFTTNSEPGNFLFWAEDEDTLSLKSDPELLEILNYSELEESEREQFSDMFPNMNFKHSVKLESLQPSTTYHYQVIQQEAIFKANFKTPPINDTVRIIILADSETDPAGRNTFRGWKAGSQDSLSTGRPDHIENYLVTESEGYRENIRIIKARNPHLILIPGDLVQGGGYQRAWDEFFFHNAGKFDSLFSYVPLIPAIGNWENFGARNGGYNPEAVQNSRAKYSAYFDAPAVDNPDHQNFYHRIDYGKVTIITLDSSNGLPDSTDADTNININHSTYPGNDLPDFNPSSEQWNWAMMHLQDAHQKGQIIFVQFHHIPYSSGGHSVPLTVTGSSGQAGIPMRVYTPYFKKYGVVAVFCGHNESFEHSVVDGIHFYDVGVAGDGLGYSLSGLDPKFFNPWQQWVAHEHAHELWKGDQLLDGGKHYGHLEVNVVPQNERYLVQFTPVYSFPVTDQNGKNISFERRIYDDEHDIRVNNRKPAP